MQQTKFIILYQGLNKMSSINPRLSIQWHITTNCNNRCKHCYMFDSETYYEERKNTLSLKSLIHIMNDIESFENKYGANISHFSITGGDPLLREDWKQFLLELKHRKKIISLMGNPDTLSEENIDDLFNIGIASFQMSLDGLETTHDTFRSKGSFNNTIDKIELLENYGIHTNIMFTLYPNNLNELIPLMRFLATKTKVSSFSFDIGCFIGNASELKNNLNHKDIQNIFHRYVLEKKRIYNAGRKIVIAEKSNLFKLTNFENGGYYPITSNSYSVISGCLAGWVCIPILSDGTVLPCRRLPIKIGKMPEQSFENIFLESTLLKKLRRKTSFQECGNCSFYQVCRGCPAYVYSLTGDPFAKNPICFRKRIQREVQQNEYILPDPPLNTNSQEEYELICSRFSSIASLKSEEAIENGNTRKIFIDLAYSSSERRKFLLNPKKYFDELGDKLDNDVLIYLMHHFGGMSQEMHVEGITNKIAELMLVRTLNELFEI